MESRNLCTESESYVSSNYCDKTSYSVMCNNQQGKKYSKLRKLKNLKQFIFFSQCKET